MTIFDDPGSKQKIETFTAPWLLQSSSRDVGSFL
jgi:hypothetical protein